MIVLGIESSCDETAAAIASNHQILSSIISSQNIHTEFGGVIPELASRAHEELLNQVVDQAIFKANISKTDLEGIAVTRGPGLAGTLLTGVCFAKGLALGLNIPILGINHLEAHIFTNLLADSYLEFPFICLLVSGGHTQLWHVEKLGKYKLLGTSRDDAAGEAFDKGARILGLDYPGGPAIEKLASNGNENAVHFPRAFYHSDELEFSFSGLKTALLYFMEKDLHIVSLADIAASYQRAIIDVLVSKLKKALEQTGVKTCVIAGGVAANQTLRKLVNKDLPAYKVIYPELSLCTDNAAMVAFLGELYMEQGVTTAIDFDIDPNLNMTH